MPGFSFCFQLSLCLSLPWVSNVCNCSICLSQRPWFLAVDKEGFCTQWSWTGNALFPFPDSKSGCSVIHTPTICQQFQTLRIEIEDNKAEGKFQPPLPELCFSLEANYKWEMMEENTEVMTKFQKFPFCWVNPSVASLLCWFW